MPADNLNNQVVEKSLELPILGKLRGKNKVTIPAMGYQMDAIAFPSSSSEQSHILTHEQSIGVNAGTSFDSDLAFDTDGPTVFGKPTLKPWADSIEALSWRYGFDHDVADGQTWNDVTFMSGVPYVEFSDIEVTILPCQISINW